MSARETAGAIARRAGAGAATTARRLRARLLGVPRKLRIPLALGTAGVLVAGGAGIAWASADTSGSDYVTAVAETGSVDELLELSGTIASASRRDLAFTVAGTVATVDVAVGDEVSAGAALASLDLGELQEAVTSAEETVARAEQQLDDDLTGQSSTSSAVSGGGGSSSASSASTDEPSTASALDDQIAAVTAAQDALLALMDAADDSLELAHTTANDATTVCEPFLTATLPTDPATFDATALAAIQDLLTTCTSAVDGVLDAADVAAAAQDAVAAAMDALDTAVAELKTAAAALVANATSGSTGAGSTGPTDTGSTGSGSTAGSSAQAGSSGSSGSTASAADIVADRAAIAAAHGALAITQAALGSAALVSPIDGTVAQVALAVGDEVTAGSTTAVITVIGDDGFLVEATVGLSALPKLEVGQTGEAVLVSSGASYDASVTAVGFVNVATDSSTPQYALTISVDSAGDTLLNGAAVRIEIGVASASDVLVVPVSAVHRTETGDTVDVLVDDAIESRTVELGAVGDVYVQIISGIEAGDVVVLADAAEEIASETDESTTGGLTGIGGSTTQTGPGGGQPPTGDFPGGAPQG